MKSILQLLVAVALFVCTLGASPGAPTVESGFEAYVARESFKKGNYVMVVEDIDQSKLNDGRMMVRFLRCRGLGWGLGPCGNPHTGDS